jgi:hypothetical protein
MLTDTPTEQQPPQKPVSYIQSLSNFYIVGFPCRF